MSLHPSVAAVRVAVRRTLAALVAEQPAGAAADAAVLVACSGGADSLALLSAAVFEGHKLGLRVIGVTVDHGLQEGSAAHAERVVAQMADARRRRDRLGPGRRSRRRARDRRRRRARRGTPCSTRWSEHFGAIAVLLGHTLDDQAETVLLGLARGSGGRSLAGMRRALRPLPPAAARRHPHRHGDRLPGRGHRVLERPAQHRPGVHPGPGPAQGAPGPRGRARTGRRRDAGPHRRPAPRRHGAPRPRSPQSAYDELRDSPTSRAWRSRRSPTCRSPPATACSGWPRSRPAPRPPSCSTCTSWRWPPLLGPQPRPAARSSCPAT